MSLEDLKQEWRNEMDHSIPPARLEQLLVMVQERFSEMERQIHSRDMRRDHRRPLCRRRVCGDVADLPVVDRGDSRCRADRLRLVLIVYVLMSSRAAGDSIDSGVGTGMLARAPGVA